MELSVPLSYRVNVDALTQILRVAVPACTGISTFGDLRPVLIFVPDGTLPTDQTTLIGLANSHDPVFLTVDKTSIVANDTDAFTITVTAPKPGAASVSLAVSVNNGAPSIVPVALTGGVGTVQFTAKDQCVIVISLQNQTNRCMDQLTIRAQ